jgi:hypothetical protein
MLTQSRCLRIRPGYRENADEHVRKSSPPSDQIKDDTFTYPFLGHRPKWEHRLSRRVVP